MQANSVSNRFIITLPKFEKLDEIEPWILKIKPGGVMLVSHHVYDREYTKQLTGSLQVAAKKVGIDPLLICIDWEGGIVSRPSEQGGFYSVPSPYMLAKAGRQICFLAGMLIGHQLADVGINVNFAPVLDLFSSKNCILATRCFSDDPRIVAECGIAFAGGLMSQGVLPVIKHFPGLGLGLQDTHLEQTKISVDSDLFDYHKKPFDLALRSGIASCMVGHAMYDQFGNIPTTLNPEAVKYLRESNPDVFLITDDFCMRAIRSYTSVDQACKASIAAGYDLIILSPSDSPEIVKSGEDPLSLDRLFQSISDWCDNSDKEFNERRNIINKIFLKKRNKLTISQEKKLCDYISLRCLKSSISRLSTNNIKLISIDLPVIRPAETWFVNQEGSFLSRMLKLHGIKVDELILNPISEDSIYELDKFIKDTPSDQLKNIFIQTMFYGGGVWNKIQKRFLEILKSIEKDITVLSLGHPYEKEVLSGAKIIDLGSFQKPMLRVVVDQLFSDLQQTGADCFIENLDKYLDGKNFGLLCNRASVVNGFNDSIEFLPDVLDRWSKATKKGEFVAIFSPEHGLNGNQQASEAVNSKDSSYWGCPVYSLYGVNKKPTQDMLRKVNFIVIDLQDVGTRCFTYVSTIKFVLEAAAENKIDVLLLDRPNPIERWGSAGPLLEKDQESFVGSVDTQFLYGKTIACLAYEMNKNIGANLSIIPCKNITDDYFLSRQFVPPSPNLMSVDHIDAYPMTVFIEGTNYSEGRGTDYPFLQIGAPWVNSDKLAEFLNEKNLKGIYFEPVSFTPKSLSGIAENPKHLGALCNGVFLHIFDRHEVQPMLVARTILEALAECFPKYLSFIKYEKNSYALDHLVGSDSWRKSIDELKKIGIVKTKLVDIE